MAHWPTLMARWLDITGRIRFASGYGQSRDVCLRWFVGVNLKTNRISQRVPDKIYVSRARRLRCSYIDGGKGYRCLKCAKAVSISVLHVVFLVRGRHHPSVCRRWDRSNYRSGAIRRGGHRIPNIFVPGRVLYDENGRSTNGAMSCLGGKPGNA